MSDGFDRIYRNAIASAAHTAVEDSWTEVREAVTAWKNDPETPTAWATYLDALYGYAETNRNACSAAQKTLDIATAAAYRDYLTDSAATVDAAEKRAANKLKDLFDAAVVTTTNAAKGIKFFNATRRCLRHTRDEGALLPAAPILLLDGSRVVNKNNAVSGGARTVVTFGQTDVIYDLRRDGASSPVSFSTLL